jgi:L-lactate dehydrogenase (cytochrome)
MYVLLSQQEYHSVDNANGARRTVLPEHPGGPKIILKYAGKDATEEYEPIHPPDTLDKYLDKSKHLGEVNMQTVEKEEKEVDPDEVDRQKRIKAMPILEQCYNLMDFEAVARTVMKKTAWAYYSSGADDEIVSCDLLVFQQARAS